MILSPAKINLYLQVVGKRDDGYHLLDSLCVFANKGDELSFTDNQETNEITLQIIGTYAHELKSLPIESNIIYKTAKMLQDHYAVGRGVHIILKKELPIASGVGGGSSNSATTMWELNKLWDLKISKKNLATLGQQMGADVSMCIYKQACYIAGVGEKVTLLEEFTPIQALMINPNQPCHTPQIFQHLHSQNHGKFSQLFEPKPTHITDITMLIDILKSTTNNLQPPAISQHPIIKEVLQSIANTNNCLFTRMSGSGATCFGIYKTQADTMQALSHIKESHPDWWVVDCMLA